ncbi:MAG: LPS export ABC transporter permease LptF [Deltaproteobacteria bacterium RIFCSPHIGHO2_02_FULL_60_17]|nr:MAG: LPS export ABC transporter permease LptF [Deltaproteobacteria bacterium RIFCSPHIGHO2_02_FULL_60_17]
MKRTLTTYVVLEILPPFLLGLAAFTMILLIARILKLVELVVTRGVPFLEIAKLFALILPTFLEMTVPMALLLAIFLGLGRLSGDHELLALKASGISPTQVLLPIAAVALAVSLITLLLTTLVRPAANLALKKELYTIAKNRVGTALKENVFNDDFPQVLIYVDELVPPGDTSQGVLIVDRRNPARENIIFSKVALIVSDEESNTIDLKLFDGALYEREKQRPSFSQTRFNTYDLKLEFDEAFSPIRKKERGPKEMSLRRLGKSIQLKESKGLRPTAELIELHQRFSFAFAPLVLSLLAVSLVMVPTRSRASRSWGFALCLTWLLVYYGLLSMGKALGEREILPPAVALWLPNIVVGLAGIRLFQKALKESPFLIQSKLEDFSLYLNRKLAHYMQGD